MQKILFLDVYKRQVDTNGSGHGALAGVLNALNADVLICGGIGGGAQTALAAACLLYTSIPGIYLEYLTLEISRS